MFLRLSITILSILVLASCARNPKNITDFDLCYKLATLPSFNINTDAREAEVRSRNLNCRVYASRIDEQKRALELEKAGANVVIYANQLLRSAFPAMQGTAQSILKHSRSLECDESMLSIKEILNLIPGTK